MKWCNQQGSNLRPPPSQGGALIQLSYGCIILREHRKYSEKKEKSKYFSGKRNFLIFICNLECTNTQDDRLYNIGNDFFSIRHEILPEEVRFIFLRYFRSEDLDMHIPIFCIVMMIAEYRTYDLL